MNYICRSCLSADSNEMESIYSIKCINNEKISISKMIALCAGLEISKYDNFTNVICKSCTSILIEAFNYRRTCWHSHVKLLEQARQKKNFEKENVSFFSVFEFINCTKEELISGDDDDEKNIENLLTENEVLNDEPVATPLPSQKLTDHVKIMLDETCYLGKRYNCGKCNYMFMRRDKIIDHLKLVHDTIVSVTNGYTCDICLKIFASRSTLWHHKKAVHNATSVICDLCGAKLKNKLTFEQHMRKHTGEKPFKCKYCDYRSAYHFGVVSHQRRAHTGEKPYICHFCNKNFVSSTTRSAHMAIHSEPKFKCLVCQKQFTTRTQHKKHTAIHDASKHLPCDVCGKKFAKRSTLVTHRKQHTGEKSYTCKECGKGFIQRYCWRTHMKNHHNQNIA